MEETAMIQRYPIAFRTAAIALLSTAFATTPAIAAPTKLSATLTGASEVAGGDPDGTGGLTATVDPETNDFCYSLWADKIAKPTMAHVHSGEAGKNGAPVLTLEVTGKNNDLCLAADKEKLEPIVTNPAGFYVNIHTADFAQGALRGQLAK
jgi:hypothetical protein